MLPSPSGIVGPVFYVTYGDLLLEVSRRVFSGACFYEFMCNGLYIRGFPSYVECINFCSDVIRRLIQADEISDLYYVEEVTT